MNQQVGINKMGLGVIGCYSVEAQEGVELSNEDMDRVMQEYIDSIKESQQYLIQQEASMREVQRQSMIAVKYSAMCPKHLLILFNHSTLALQSLYNTISNTQTLTIHTLTNYILLQDPTISNQHIHYYITNILNINHYTQSTLISQLHWNIYVNSLYLHSHFNHNPVVKLFNQYTQDQYQQLQSFINRVDQICHYAKQLNVNLFIDAEQSYIQKGIDNIVKQLQIKYNQENNVIFNTFQNYLKQTKNRIEFEMEKNQYLNMKTAVKLVRGAYMVEENEISVRNNTDSLICDGYNATTHNYHSNLKHILSNMQQGSNVLVASHNQQTAEYAIQLASLHCLPAGSLMFAQLMGLSDDITFALKQQGFFVYKYVPYGPIHVMIPYLCRRAVESYQIIANVDIQINYIQKSIFNKLTFNNNTNKTTNINKAINKNINNNNNNNNSQQ